MSDDVADWLAWHDPYDEPGSPLSRRLRLVQDHISAWLLASEGRPVRAVSACAGQGRDLLESLARAPDASAVTARLVELDPRNVEIARRAARAAGLDGVEVVCGDAGVIDAYLGAVPADLVLMCGVFGNVGDDDVRRTVGLLPQLCAPGATVIWTRSRRAPDLTPDIRHWFGEAGFEEQAFDAPSDALFSVGVHKLVAEPVRPEPGGVMFRFV